MEIRENVFYRFLYWFGGKNEIVHRLGERYIVRLQTETSMRCAFLSLPPPRRTRRGAAGRRHARFVFLRLFLRVCLFVYLFT